MNVFISWSGSMSQQVANALHDWLPKVIQAIKPFVSDEDINKGEFWHEALAKNLEDAEFGIICVTPYNVKKPWLYFEAGALSRSIDRSGALLSPFLFLVNSSELEGPLSQFQSTPYRKEEVLKLLSSINEKLDNNSRLNKEQLKNTFSNEWEQLKKTLDGIGESQEGETETGYTQEGETETGFPWLYTPRDLGQFEVTADYKSIWLVNPSPYEDLQNPSFTSKNMVQQNIKRGIRYTFIFPSLDDKTQEEEVMKTFKEFFLSSPQQLTITKIPKETFYNLAVTHYHVLYSEENSNFLLKVFLKLPLKQADDYWMEVEYEAAHGLAARFRKMIKEGGITMIKEGKTMI